MEAVWRFEGFVLTFDGFAVICKPYPAKYRLPFTSYDKSGNLLSDDHKRMPERVPSTYSYRIGHHHRQSAYSYSGRHRGLSWWPYAQLKGLFSWFRKIDILRFVLRTMSINLVLDFFFSPVSRVSVSQMLNRRWIVRQCPLESRKLPFSMFYPGSCVGPCEYFFPLNFLSIYVLDTPAKIYMAKLCVSNASPS